MIVSLLVFFCIDHILLSLATLFLSHSRIFIVDITSVSPSETHCIFFFSLPHFFLYLSQLTSSFFLAQSSLFISKSFLLYIKPILPTYSLFLLIELIFITSFHSVLNSKLLYKILLDISIDYSLF